MDLQIVLEGNWWTEVRFNLNIIRGSGILKNLVRELGWGVHKGFKFSLQDLNLQGLSLNTLRAKKFVQVFGSRSG